MTIYRNSTLGSLGGTAVAMVLALALLTAAAGPAVAAQVKSPATSVIVHSV